MSIVVAEVYEALVSAGAPADKARAAAAAIPIGEQLATKQDLEGVKAEITGIKVKDLAEIRAEIAVIKATMRYNTTLLMLVIGLLIKLVFFP